MDKRINHDIFGPGSNFAGRVFCDYELLREKIESCRTLGLKIVLASGTYDLFHIGHSRYLEAAKQYGDILIVGVDSDEKVKQKKGPHRPIVNQEERMEILCHSRYVDLVFLKETNDPKWHLVQVARPDVLIVTRRVYEEKDLDGIKEYCGEIKFLESQATTSTTARIRGILVDPVEKIKERLKNVVNEVYDFLDRLTGTSGDKE